MKNLVNLLHVFDINQEAFVPRWSLKIVPTLEMETIRINGTFAVNLVPTKSRETRVER